MSLHPNQDKIVDILSKAEPNPNLMAKAQQNYNIAEQLSREQKLYNAVVNPITQEPVTNIQQLNELIQSLDAHEAYGFSALLPNAPGGVEEYLSKEYNLRLVESKRFSESEQEAIKNYIHDNLVRPALDLLAENGNVYAGKKVNVIIKAIAAAMGAVNIKQGNMQIFTSFSEFQEQSSYNLGQNRTNPFGVTKSSEVGTMRFVYNILKGDSKVSIKLDQDDDGIVKEFEIQGDLNSLTEGTRKALFDWANSDNLNLLDPSRKAKAPLNPGGGTTAPGSVTAEKWKTDVYNAINACLGTQYRNLMQLEQDEINNLFNKYHIGTEIALGRQLINLRGFLGELRGILIVDAICPNAKGRLTGTLKVNLATQLSKKGQSAPTDLLVQLIDGLNIGIQIKNTSDLQAYSWGNYRSEKGMPVTSFYAERLQEDITDSERNFFGAYVYNQPINQSNYKNIYDAFQGTFELFYWVYQKLALYIIRQTTEIKEDEDNLFNGTVKNDFFIMNNVIVPTSALYKALNEQSDLVKSNFKFSTSSKGYYSYDAPIPDNYLNYASQLLVTYSVELQYAKLLQSAYNMI